MLGGAGHPSWQLLYPHFTNKERAKVMTYIRIHDRDHIFKKNYLKGSARLDLCAHPCILITDISFHKTKWRTINFYNDVDDPTALHTLLSLQLDPLTPTLLTGDFNSHSRTWSPRGWGNYSTSAAQIEGWAASQGLQLLSEAGVVTHRGENGARDSTIDLMWCNFAAWRSGAFGGVEIDWEGSLLSDHALLRTKAIVPRKLKRLPEDRSQGFSTDISAQAWEDWTRILKICMPPVTPLRSKEDVDAKVDELYLAINTACRETMKKRGAAPGFNAKWWNEECREAARAVRGANSPEDRAEVARNLKRIIQRRKREWADQYIASTNIWEVAAWRHGRKTANIPALRDEEGNMHYDHQEMADMLANRFFAPDKGPIPTRFEDDPEARAERPHEEFNEEELESLLKETSNSSAPGSSGIGWLLVKRAWPVISEVLTSIYNACVSLGHHPGRWKEAMVVVIPKPDKPDYSVAKAHRPISLLETLSKLLEKAIAKRFQHDIVKHELVPSSQFGGRMHSSCLDAALTLIHDVQAAHAAGLKTAMLLFDVKGFFDYINHARMTAVLTQLGFNRKIVEWTRNFLKERRVRLKFNCVTAEERTQPVGVPQGSPLSPVLSIIYTSGLLHQMKYWNNSSLGMYVDDGALFACAEEWADVNKLLRARYTVCEEWLRRSGLAIEPDKTELIYFQKAGVAYAMPAPTRLELPLPSDSNYEVFPSDCVRYLGFFIQRRLNWKTHVTIMCNRAKASANALKLLGNTIRGLSMANWRLVLNAVCLPVLGYGCQLWYVQGRSKGLIKQTQKVQNQMVRMVAGAFRTAPCEPLTHITRMLPMEQYVEKLTHTSALRLYRLPRASQLLRRLGPDWYSPRPGDNALVVPENMPSWGKSKQRPTVLEALARRVPSHGPKVDWTVIAPWEIPNWAAQTSHWGVTNPAARVEWVQSLMDLGLHSGVEVIFTAAKVTGRDLEGSGELIPVGGASVVSQWGSEEPRTWKWTMGSEAMQFDVNAFALAKAAEVLASTYTEGVAPPQVIYILSTDNSALQAIRNPRSIKAHSHCIRFHKALTTFFLIHRDVRLVLVWSPKNDDLRSDLLSRTLAAEASLEFPPEGMDSIQSAAYQKGRAKARAFQQWERQYRHNRMQEEFRTRWLGVVAAPPRFCYQHAISDPPSIHHHPLWKEATSLTKKVAGQRRKPKYTRRTTSTALQLAVDHAFTGSYARRFRPSDPPETTLCVCSPVLRDPHHLLTRCPLFHQQRVDAVIITDHRTLSLKQLFQTHPDHLLAFLQAPGIARPPPNTSQREWMEEEADTGVG